MTTDPFTVSENEKGLVRLFALDMSPEQAEFLREPGAAAQVLGVDDLDETQIEVFPVADLGDLGLDGYLVEGFGIAPDRIAPDRARLKAVTGWAMALRSRAFGDRPVTLTPADPLRLIGVWAEPGTDWSGGPMDSDSTGREPLAAPRAARARSRAVGGVVFAVVMLLLLILVWFMAG